MGGRRIAALVVALTLITGVLSFDQSVSSAQAAGSNLAHEVTATDPARGGQIRLEDVQAFASSGGEAVFEPGTASEERFTYSGKDGVDRLFGISRTNPVAHPSGSFVQALAQAEASPSPRPTTTGLPSPSPSETTSTTSGSSTSTDSSGDSSTSDSSVSASDSTTTTWSSTTAVSDPCASIDCYGVVENLLMALSADPCDPYNGGIDCGALIQDVLDRIGTAEPPPDPCDPYNGGIDCDALIQDVLNSIGSVEPPPDPCDPYNGGYDCNALVQDVLGLLNTDPCDPYNGGIDCDAVIQYVLAALSYDPCDPYNGGYDCNAVVQDVLALVNTDPCDPYNGGIDCDALIQDVLNSIGSVEPPPDPCDPYNGGYDCNALVQDVLALVNTDPCDPYNGGIDCDALIQDVLNSIGSVEPPPDPCDPYNGGYDCNALVQDVLGLLNTDPCDPYNGGIDCQGLINSLAKVTDDICPTGAATCADPYVQLVGSLIDDLYYEVCGPNDMSGCQAKYNDMVEGLLNLVCSSTTSSGTQACLDMVSEAAGKAIDDLYYAACGPNDLSGCQAKYNDMVEGLLNAVCSSTTTSGTQACIDMVNGIARDVVDEAYRTACPTDTTSDACVDRYIATVVGVVIGAADTIYEVVCGTYPTSDCLKDYETRVTTLVNDLFARVCGTSSPGAQACVDMVNGVARGVIDKAYRIACPTDTTSDACVDRYITTVVGVVTGAADQVYRTVCPTDLSSDACFQRYVSELSAVVDQAVGSIYRVICPGDASEAACIERYKAAVTTIVTEAVDSIYRIACPTASALDMCIVGYEAQVSKLVNDLALTLYQVVCTEEATLDPASVSSCSSRYAGTVSAVLLGVVDTVYGLVCPPYSLVLDCGAEYADQVADLVEGLSGTVYDLACPSDPTTNACANRYVAVLLGVVNDIVELVCASGADSCANPYLELVNQLIVLIQSVDPEIVIPNPGTPCPEGPPPWQAEDLPPVIPGTCDLIGLSILDQSVGAKVPLPGEGVTIFAGLQRFRIKVQVDATVILLYVGDEGLEPEITSIPAAPTNLAASAASAHKINLTWTDNASNESGFSIERASASGGPFSRIATVSANGTSFTDSGLNGSTSYFYRVQTYNNGGASGYSNEATATTPAAPAPPPVPSAPSSLTATSVSTAQINLHWQDNSGDESGFIIERSTSGDGYSQIASVPANTSGYASEDLAPGTTYGYRVRAYNSSGSSTNSNEAWATTVSSATTDSAGTSQPPSVQDPTPEPSPSPTSGGDHSDPDADDVDLETGQAGTGGCKDGFYELITDSAGNLQRLYDTLQWRFVRGTYPSYFNDNDKQRALERFKDAGEHMAKGYTTCRGDWAQGDPVPGGIGFTMGNSTDKAGDFDVYESEDADKKQEFECGEAHKEGTKKQFVTHDKISQMEFGNTHGAAGVTCNWDRHTASGPEEIFESDIRFANNPFGASFPGGEWFTTNKVPDRCSNKADLEGVATHERGHTMGLDDVYDNGDGHPGLTMGDTNDNCTKQSRSLGKGDVLGLKDLYSRS